MSRLGRAMTAEIITVQSNCQIEARVSLGTTMLTASFFLLPGTPSTSEKYLSTRTNFCKNWIARRLSYRTLSPSMSSFWQSNASSNEGLVKNLKRASVIKSDAVFDAMTRTDRAKYLAQIETPDGGHVGELAAYQDVPHPIGYHQTISAPHMHAHAMELGYVATKSVSNPRILDVGAGSGYLTACLGRMVENNGGRVFGLEIVPGLVQFAKKNIQMADGDLIDQGIVSVRCHNGWDGLANEAPFHFIHVGAAAETPPQALMDQLADGGHLVLPLDEARGGQVLVEITRNGTVFSERRLFGVCYVPLVRERQRKLS